MNDIIDRAIAIFRTVAPHRTGFMKSNISYVSTADGFELYIDENTVPYAKYTMDKWTHERWGGRANPNEDWQMEAGDILVSILKHLLNATTVDIKEGE